MRRIRGRQGWSRTRVSVRGVMMEGGARAALVQVMLCLETVDLVCGQQGIYESIKAEVPGTQELLRDSNFTVVMVGWNGVCEREQFSNWC